LQSQFPPSPFPTSSSSNGSGSNINNNSNFNPSSNLYDVNSICNNAMDVDIDADQVYKPRRELKNIPLNYTTKNKNKYGQDYGHN
jgi:hypothetical protein